MFNVTCRILAHFVFGHSTSDHAVENLVNFHCSLDVCQLLTIFSLAGWPTCTDFSLFHLDSEIPYTGGYTQDYSVGRGLAGRLRIACHGGFQPETSYSGEQYRTWWLLGVLKAR